MAVSFGTAIFYGCIMENGYIFETVTSGRAEIVDYINARRIKVRFIDTGFEAWCHSANINRGNIKDYIRPSVFGIGFLGVGPHRTTQDDGRMSVVHSRWHGMMERCYSERYQKLKPTYIGCVVADEWHCFQTFAEWFDENYIEGFELDKDKLGNGKLYSKDTCCFISRAENCEISQAKKYVLKYKDGSLHNVFNLSKFCRENNLTRANVHKVINGTRTHHKGWSVP